MPVDLRNGSRVQILPLFQYPYPVVDEVKVPVLELYTIIQPAWQADVRSYQLLKEEGID